MQLQSFIYCKIVKSTTKSNPNDDALQSQVPLWWNTEGLCEVQSRISVVNRSKHYPDYFPGGRFNKEVQPTLSLNLNSELTYSEMGNSEFLGYRTAWTELVYSTLSRLTLS